MIRESFCATIISFFLFLAAEAACPTADLTGDCKVDMSDFGVLAGQWLNGSDIPELEELAGQWLVHGQPDPDITWVMINDSGVGMKDIDGNLISQGGFVGEMSKYETTNAQYCQFLNAALAAGEIVVVDSWVYASDDTNHSRPYIDTYDHNTWPSHCQIIYENGSFWVLDRDGYSMADHPVVMVSWYGAKAFAGFYGWNLPTQWQWQAAADYDGSFNYGYGVDIDGSKANFFGGDYNPLNLGNEPYTSPIGYYGEFGYGLCDISGNVWEWTDSIENGEVVIRGGGWYYSNNGCMVNDTDFLNFDYMNYFTGFRVCRITPLVKDNIEDFETGDFSKYSWQHPGDANWTVITGPQVYEGEFSARSGIISDNQSSVLTLTINIQSTEVSFYSKVSSEADCDYLYFQIDGNEPVDSWSGEQDWALHTYAITPGIHTLIWYYYKDYSNSNGEDCAWVDLISPLVKVTITQPEIDWVTISDDGSGMKDNSDNPISEGGFNGQMGRYEVTNAQYCHYLNDALSLGKIVVYEDKVYAAEDTAHASLYYDMTGEGITYPYFTGNLAIDGGAARISYADNTFTVETGFEDHPVTYVSWYGATAFADLYGWYLPTQWQWQAVADYDGSYTYGCGVDIYNNAANYFGSAHYDGTTAVGAFGTYGYGLADMTGNVIEWTCSLREFNGETYYELRGGAWLYYPEFCRVAYRCIDKPETVYSFAGFRVCRD